MAPGVALSRVFFRYKVFGVIAMDVQEAKATIDALTAVAAPATMGARMITLTQAKDGIARSFDFANIAGYEDKTLVTDNP